MAEFMFILLGALSFAFTGSLFLVVWSVILWVVFREVRRLYRAHRLTKARKEIRGRERKRIARMIRNKANEEEWLRFLNGFDDVDPDN